MSLREMIMLGLRGERRAALAADEGGVMFAVVVIPWGDRLVPHDLGVGVFYFIVVMDSVVLGLSLGGWGANVRDSVDVYYRGVAQLVAYVVPLGLAYIGAIMMAGSLSTQRIVEAQAGMWFVALQPIGFLLYLATGLMQAYRPPFLEPFSAFIRGRVYRSSAGWQAIGWRIAMSATLFLVATMGAVLYLGGWRGPVLPGPFWMLIKTYGLMAFSSATPDPESARMVGGLLMSKYMMARPGGQRATIGAHFHRGERRSILHLHGDLLVLGLCGPSTCLIPAQEVTVM
ncbi:MAG: NADH-quinone oxidoreductase subunit H [Thermoleophilia bacterium]